MTCVSVKKDFQEKTIENCKKKTVENIQRASLISISNHGLILLFFFTVYYIHLYEATIFNARLSSFIRLHECDTWLDQVAVWSMVGYLVGLGDRWVIFVSACYPDWDLILYLIQFPIPHSKIVNLVFMHHQTSCQLLFETGSVFYLRRNVTYHVWNAEKIMHYYYHVPV